MTAPVDPRSLQQGRNVWELTLVRGPDGGVALTGLELLVKA
jgi:hypothetical protein